MKGQLQLIHFLRIRLEMIITSSFRKRLEFGEIGVWMNRGATSRERNKEALWKGRMEQRHEATWSHTG